MIKIFNPRRIYLFLGIFIFISALTAGMANASDNIIKNKCLKSSKICMDNIPPEVILFDYSVSRTKIKFIFEINEKNFKNIVYKDTALCDGDCVKKVIHYGTLCNGLPNGKCSSVRNFCKGKHYIEITIKDKAGNTNTEIKKNIEI
ncbi:hypothetical protein J4429_02590 [Candidatus Pacearchaeota archaeon]|nr:hypothetical protein [Candidatus Pacearchaeota archaeon]